MTSSAAFDDPLEDTVAGLMVTSSSHFGKMFSLLDAHGRGRIVLSSVHQFNATLPESIRMPESDLTNAFNSYDIDRSGDIDLEEFHGLCKKISSVTKLSVENMAEHYHKQQCRRLFDLVDESGHKDRSISKYELQTFLETVKESPDLKYSQLGARIKQLDVGKIIAQQMAQGNNKGGAVEDDDGENNNSSAGSEDDIAVESCVSFIAEAGSAAPTSAATLNFVQFCHVIDKIIDGSSISQILTIFAEAAMKRRQRRERAMTHFSRGAKPPPVSISLDDLKARAAATRSPRQQSLDPNFKASSDGKNGKHSDDAALREKVAELEQQLKATNEQLQVTTAELAASREEETSASTSLRAALDEVELLKKKIEEEKEQREALEQAAASKSGQDGGGDHLKQLESLREELAEIKSARNLLNIRITNQHKNLTAEKATVTSLRESVSSLTEDNEELKKNIAEQEESMKQLQRDHLAALAESADAPPPAMRRRGSMFYGPNSSPPDLSGSTASPSNRPEDGDDSANAVGGFEEFAFSSGITFKLPSMEDDWWEGMKVVAQPPSQEDEDDDVDEAHLQDAHQKDLRSIVSSIAELERNVEISTSSINKMATKKRRSTGPPIATDGDVSPSPNEDHEDDAPPPPPLEDGDDNGHVVGDWGEAADENLVDPSQIKDDPHRTTVMVASHLVQSIESNVAPSIQHVISNANGVVEKLERFVERLGMPCQVFVQLHQSALEDLQSLAKLTTLTRMVDVEDENEEGGTNHNNIILTDEAQEIKDSLESFLENMNLKKASAAPRQDMCNDLLKGELLPQRAEMEQLTSMLMEVLAVVEATNGSTLEVLDDSTSTCSATPTTPSSTNWRKKIAKAFSNVDHSVLQVVKLTTFFMATMSPSRKVGSIVAPSAATLNTVREMLGLDINGGDDGASGEGAGFLMVEALAMIMVAAMEGTSSSAPCSTLPHCVAQFLSERRKRCLDGKMMPSILDEAEQQLVAFSSHLDAVASYDHQQRTFKAFTDALSEYQDVVRDCTSHFSGEAAAQKQAQDEKDRAAAAEIEKRRQDRLAEVGVGTECTVVEVAVETELEIEERGSSPVETSLLAPIEERATTQDHEAQTTIETMTVETQSIILETATRGTHPITSNVTFSTSSSQARPSTKDSGDGTSGGVHGDIPTNVKSAVAAYITDEEKALVANRLRQGGMQQEEWKALMATVVEEIKKEDEPDPSVLAAVGLLQQPPRQPSSGHSPTASLTSPPPFDDGSFNASLNLTGSAFMPSPHEAALAAQRGAHDSQTSSPTSTSHHTTLSNGTTALPLVTTTTSIVPSSGSSPPRQTMMSHHRVDSANMDMMSFMRNQASLRSKLERLTAELSEMHTRLSNAQRREDEILAMNAEYATKFQAQQVEMTKMSAACATHEMQMEGMATKMVILEKYISKLEKENLALSDAI